MDVMDALVAVVDPEAAPAVELSTPCKQARMADMELSGAEGLSTPCKVLRGLKRPGSFIDDDPERVHPLGSPDDVNVSVVIRDVPIYPSVIVGEQRFLSLTARPIWARRIFGIRGNFSIATTSTYVKLRAAISAKRGKLHSRSLWRVDPTGKALSATVAITVDGRDLTVGTQSRPVLILYDREHLTWLYGSLAEDFDAERGNFKVTPAVQEEAAPAGLPSWRGSPRRVAAASFDRAELEMLAKEGVCYQASKRRLVVRKCKISTEVELPVYFKIYIDNKDIQLAAAMQFSETGELDQLAGGGSQSE
jgi:hypothetical protein